MREDYVKFCFYSVIQVCVGSGQAQGYCKLSLDAPSVAAHV